MGTRLVQGWFDLGSTIQKVDNAYELGLVSPGRESDRQPSSWWYNNAVETHHLFFTTSTTTWTMRRQKSSWYQYNRIPVLPKTQKTPSSSKTWTRRGKYPNGWPVCKHTPFGLQCTHSTSHSGQLRCTACQAWEIYTTSPYYGSNPEPTKGKQVLCALCARDIADTWIDIDKTLARIEDLSNNQQDIAADESLILRGSVHSLTMLFVPWPWFSPQPGQIGIYKDALERLNSSIAFNASDTDLVQIVSVSQTVT